MFLGALAVCVLAPHAREPLPKHTLSVFLLLLLLLLVMLLALLLLLACHSVALLVLSLILILVFLLVYTSADSPLSGDNASGIDRYSLPQDSYWTAALDKALYTVSLHWLWI